MMARLKQLILLGVVVAAVYFLLTRHFVFYGTQVTTLEKDGYTLEHTFVNVNPTEFRTPENILRNDTLRDAGVGEVMVEFGIITHEKLQKIEEKIRSE